MSAAAGDHNRLAAQPDAFEGAPFQDDDPGTTQNLIAIGQEPQAHTLHAAQDADWARAVVAAFAVVDGVTSPASHPFALQFSDIQVPDGAIVLVEAFLNGVGEKATHATALRPSDNGSTKQLSVGFISGYREFPFRVELFMGGVEPELRYKVALVQTTGANNGVATQVSREGVIVTWDTSGFGQAGLGSPRRQGPGSAVGFNVVRQLDFDGEPVTVNPTPLPLPAELEKCPIFVGSGMTCMSFVDRSIESNPNASLVHLYQIFQVFQKGEPKPFTVKSVSIVPAGFTFEPTPTPEPRNAARRWRLYE